MFCPWTFGEKSVSESILGGFKWKQVETQKAEIPVYKVKYHYHSFSKIIVEGECGVIM